MRLKIRNYDSFILFFAPYLNFGAGIVVDLYAPSLPEILTELSTNATMIQATIVSSIIGYAIGQLFFGILSDWIGRRISLIFGMLLFSTISLLAFYTKSIEALILFRFIQGFATGCCQVVARSIISDQLKGHKFNIGVIYLSVAFASGLIFGPYIGTIIKNLLNWRFNFILYFIYGISVIVISVLYMKESLKIKNKITPVKSISSIRPMLKNREFDFYLIQLGCSFFCFTLWNQVGPLIIAETFGAESIYFSRIALLTGASYLGGTLVNRFLIERFSQSIRMNFSLVFSFLGVLLISLSGGSFNIYLLVSGLSLINLAQGVLFPCILSKAMSIFKNKAGLASSLQGSGMLLIGFIGLYAVSFFDVNSGLSLSLFYLFAIIIFTFSQRKLKSVLIP